MTVVTALNILPAHDDHVNGMDSATSPAPGASAAPATSSTLRYEEIMSVPQRVRQSLEKDDRLTPDQARVLRLLEGGTRGQAQLMLETGFTKHKLSTLIGQLRKRALVKPELDHQDSRKHTIKIKRQGRDLLRKLDEITREHLAQLPNH